MAQGLRALHRTLRTLLVGSSLCYTCVIGLSLAVVLTMSYQGNIQRAVTEAVQAALSVVRFDDCQMGDVGIGYVAGRDIHLHVNLVLKKNPRGTGWYWDLG